jgi:hypothetical protein
MDEANIQESMDMALSDQNLDDLDIDYTIECINDQLSDILNMSSKKNYLKRFESKIDKLDNEDPNVVNMREEVYSNIIDSIAERFKFEVDKDTYSLGNVAKVFYKFFVLEYTDNLVHFLESYIMENQQSILRYLDSNTDIVLNTKRIEGVDTKISNILNNISDVIDIINGSNIAFDEYLEYIYKHPESSSSVEEMKDYNETILADTDNIIPAMFESLIDENEGFGKVYSELQMNIFKKFSTIE